jgi:hypothetical protein
MKSIEVETENSMSAMAIDLEKSRYGERQPKNLEELFEFFDKSWSSTGTGFTGPADDDTVDSREKNKRNKTRRGGRRRQSNNRNNSTSAKKKTAS